MSSTIKVEDLAEKIVNELASYTLAIAEEVKNAVDETSQELLENIKADAPDRTGQYKKAMAIKTVSDEKFQKTNVWYVKKPYYRLPHLLEKGHAKRNGGRTRAFPHIVKNWETAKQKFDERVERAVKNGGQ